MKYLIVIFLCALTFMSFGQLVGRGGELYHNDPYKMANLLSLDLSGYEKQMIQKNRVKSISCVDYELDKSLRIKGKAQPVIYIIEFNSKGNPISYKQSHCKKKCDYYEYSFDYDSLGNLIHIRELIDRSYTEGYDDVDLYFFYNHENSVIKEMVSEKNIYPPGYKFRGTPYQSDTFIYTSNINYDTNKMVTSVIKYRSDYMSMIKAKEFDTISYSCTFDNMFITRNNTNIDRGIVLDSLGNIIEQVVFRYLHATPTNDTQFVYKYQYDNQNRIIKTQLYNAVNMLSNTWYFEYSADGLLHSEMYIDTKNRRKTVYIYEKY